MKRMDNLDILPMAAVALMVVLMMMVLAPMTMTHTNTPVEVPKAHTAEAKTEENLTITYTIDKKLYINDQPVLPEQFDSIITKAIEKDPYQLVVIRADKNVLHRDVLEILTRVKQAGAKRIACATKKPKE
jgi:biopolymer transport protein ExbD|uniref:Biopolymer transporter ExbD n=1 Tax=candidate division WOR-3 bacterium TaxID=2052148 RepID=A0A7V3RIQ2_UNCW3